MKAKTYTTDNAGNDTTGEKECYTELDFISFVIHGDQVDGALGVLLVIENRATKAMTYLERIQPQTRPRKSDMPPNRRDFE
jgi:hypothetical protein